MLSLDLLRDPAKPLDKLVIATLGQAWFGDQIVDNTVIVQQGLNGEVFVKLPDGRYNPPPSIAIELTEDEESNGVYYRISRRDGEAGSPLDRLRRSSPKVYPVRARPMSYPCYVTGCGSWGQRAFRGNRLVPPLRFGDFCSA